MKNTIIYNAIFLGLYYHLSLNWKKEAMVLELSPYIIFAGLISDFVMRLFELWLGQKASDTYQAIILFFLTVLTFECFNPLQTEWFGCNLICDKLSFKKIIASIILLIILHCLFYAMLSYRFSSFLINSTMLKPFKVRMIWGFKFIFFGIFSKLNYRFGNLLIGMIKLLYFILFNLFITPYYFID